MSAQCTAVALRTIVGKHHLIQVLLWEPHPSGPRCHRLFQWVYLHILYTLRHCENTLVCRLCCEAEG